MKSLISLLIENPDTIEFKGNRVYYNKPGTYPFGYFNYNLLTNFIEDFESIVGPWDESDTRYWYADEDIFAKLSNLCGELRKCLIKVTKEPIKPSDFFVIGESGETHNSIYLGIDPDIWSFVIDMQGFLGRDFLKCCGRIFTKQKLISFWKHPTVSEMKMIIDDLEDNLSIIIDSDWYVEVYEKGRYEQIPVDEYIGSDELSYEELAKKHMMSPTEKEKFGIKNDSEVFGSYKQSDIANKAGFENYAEYNDMRKTSESVIKLKDLIKENPDVLYDDDEKLSYTTNGALPFGYYNDSLLKNYLNIYNELSSELKKNPVDQHEVNILRVELFDQLQEIRETINSNLYKTLQTSDELYLGISNEIHGSMSDFPFDPMSDEIRLIRKELRIGTRQLLKFPGRIWKYNQVISFWILPDKNTLLKIINDFKSIYNIDINNALWRIELEDGSLIPITEFDNTSVIVNKDFAKPHVLSPIEKERIRSKDLKDEKTKNDVINSQKGVGSDKQGNRAVRAGFENYAEYNDMRKTSESSIKLKDLIKENPDAIEFDDIPYVKWSDKGAYPFGYYKTHLLDDYIKAHDKWTDSMYTNDDNQISLTKKELDKSVDKLRDELKHMQTESISSDDKFYIGSESSVHPEFKLPIDFSSNYITTLREKYKIDYKKLIQYPGRIWLIEKVISFWYYPNESVLKHILNDIRKNLNVDFNDPNWQVELKPSNFDADLLPLDKYYKGYDRTEKDIETSHVLSPSEKESRGIHKDTNGFGSEKQGDLMNKAGFTTYAQYNASRRTSESQIKLKSLIMEDPDTVYFDDDSTVYMAEEGAFPFAYYKKGLFSTYIELYNEWTNADTKELHDNLKSDMDKLLKQMFDEFSSQGDNILPDDVMFIGSERDYHTSINLSIRRPENRSALLYFYDRAYIEKAQNVRLLHCPGRIWTVQKIISLYRFPDRSSFKKILNDLRDKLHVDFSDSDWLVDLKTGDVGGKLLPLSEYYPVENYTDKEMEQMHLLSPTEKEKRGIVKQNDGYGSVKQGDIANKSGYNSYAHYNADRSTSEHKIKLKDLLK